MTTEKIIQSAGESGIDCTLCRITAQELTVAAHRSLPAGGRG